MQRLLATAGVVMLVSLTPVNAPDDTTSAVETVTPRGVPTGHLDTASKAANEFVPAPVTDALPSLAALDAAFDVVLFPALAALDLAFDNAPVELPPVPLPSRRPPTYAEMCATLASAATAHSLPTPFLIRLIWQESRFRHNVISHAGAQGIAQFMPETATYVGLDDPFDALESLTASAQLLHKLIARFGNLGLAAAAYNAGPKRVLDWLADKGELPKETQDYVRTVTGRAADDWRKPETTAALPRLPASAPCQREAGLYAANGPAQIPLPTDAPYVNPEKTLLAAVDVVAADDRRVVAGSDTTPERKMLKALAKDAVARAAAAKPAQAKASVSGSAKARSAAGEVKAKSGRSARSPSPSAKKFAVTETR